MDPFALQRLVWASLSPLSSPCVLRGLCALDSVPEVHPLRRSLVCACLGFQDTHSASPGLCPLVSALRAGPGVTGLVWNCFGSRCLPYASWGLCALVSFHCLHSLLRGLFVLSAVPGGLCVLPKSVCLPSIGTPVPPFVPAVCLASDTRLPGLALCAARVVRTGWVCLHWLRLSAVSNSAGFICHATWRPGVFCCRLEVAL